MKHKIVIFEKSMKTSDNDHNRIMFPEVLVQTLQRLFVDNDLAEVISVNPFYQTWKEQVTMIRDATIVITGGGGIAFLASFLRSNAALILLDRNYRGKSLRFIAPAGNDDQWFSNLDIHMVYYQTCHEEEDDGNIYVVYPRMYMLILQTMIAIEKHPSYTEFDANKTASWAFRHNKREMSNKILFPYVNTEQGYKLTICDINADSFVPFINESDQLVIPTQIAVTTTKVDREVFRKVNLVPFLDPGSRTSSGSPSNESKV